MSEVWQLAAMQYDLWEPNKPVEQQLLIKKLANRSDALIDRVQQCAVALCEAYLLHDATMIDWFLKSDKQKATTVRRCLQNLAAAERGPQNKSKLARIYEVETGITAYHGTDEDGNVTTDLSTDPICALEERINAAQVLQLISEQSAILQQWLRHDDGEKLRQEDVAALCGVHQSTVSRHVEQTRRLLARDSGKAA